MTIIAVRDADGALLEAVSEAPDNLTARVLMADGTIGPERPTHAILARGGWREPTEEEKGGTVPGNDQ